MVEGIQDMNQDPFLVKGAKLFQSLGKIKNAFSKKNRGPKQPAKYSVSTKQQISEKGYKDKLPYLLGGVVALVILLMVLKK